MKIKVETEKKYYCMEPEKLARKAERLGFKEINNVFESDEYFTDINSEFILNRTCLRIRITGNDKMEITYKGKSNSLLGQYCKLENNITAAIDEYNNLVSLFSSLGYYSYVKVNKERHTYTLKDNKYAYSIMLDKLPNIGGFVEFEIISEKEDSSKEELKKELDTFVSKFSDLNMKEANKPYRDIVANDIYNTLVKSKDVTDLYIDLDEEIVSYEKDFYKKYKDQISKICNTSIKWGMYKRNKDIDNKISSLVDSYLDNLIFDSNSLLVTMELLKKLDYKKHFVTKANEVFFTHLFGKLNIAIDNVLYLNDEPIKQFIKKEKININDVIMLNNKSLDEINSNLLIIINNRYN